MVRFLLFLNIKIYLNPLITRCLIFFILFVASNILNSQNEFSKWYFGYNAGLDFSTSPPSVLSDGLLVSTEGCATICDNNANLLFYTNGVMVKNANHAFMANGNGLAANGSSSQAALIVKQPGNNSNYYIFTTNGLGVAAYSIVDMSLAAGMGSVTVKNYTLYSPTTEKQVAVQHCNKKDVWIISHEYNSNNFRAYLLSASGLNLAPVISSVGDNIATVFTAIGHLKASPAGNKLAMTNYGSDTTNISGAAGFQLFDFNATTGVVSNSLTLITNLNQSKGFYGAEFSPDGSKVYCALTSFVMSESDTSTLYQWDLCQPNNLGILSTQYSHTVLGGVGSIQKGIDDKLYVSGSATGATSTLSVIQNPNNSGAAMNFLYNSINVAPATVILGLPNYISSYQQATPSPFTHTFSSSLGCHGISFTAYTNSVGCAASNFALTSLSWDFGDPSTGNSNSSNSQNPIHVFSSSGIYTVTLVYNYTCGSDTLKQLVNVPPPNIAVTWSVSCNNPVSATVTALGGIGPFTYSWTPSSQTTTVVSNLSSGVYSVSLTDLGLGCKVSTVISVSAISSPDFSFVPSNIVQICSGNSANINIAGNATSYSWTPNVGVNIIGNSLFINVDISQTYTVIASLNSCTSSANLRVDLIPLPSAIIQANKEILCVNSVLKLNGEGGDLYEWSGPAGFKSSLKKLDYLISSQAAAGIYTLTVTDQNGCKNSTTKQITLLPLPTGSLAGIIPDGCVPFYSEFKFLNSNLDINLVSTWEINHQNFKEPFNYWFAEPGTYTLNGQLTDTSSSCTNTLSYVVNAHARPRANFNQKPEQIIENSGEPVIFTNTSTGASQTDWTWYFYSENKSWFTKNMSGECVENYFSQAGSYVLAFVVKDKWNCSDTIIKNLIVEEDYTVWMPNAFTPNDDGTNDVFSAITRGVSQFNLKIFNRWGTLIFESNEASQSWDGNYNGQFAPDGVYTWIVETTSNEGKSKIQSGNVILLR